MLPSGQRVGLLLLPTLVFVIVLFVEPSTGNAGHAAMNINRVKGIAYLWQSEYVVVPVEGGETELKLSHTYCSALFDLFEGDI